VVELFNKLHKQSNFEEIKKRNTSIIANWKKMTPEQYKILEGELKNV
jgi:hypothetical protein